MVVAVFALGDRRACRGFGGHDLRVAAAMELLPQERERQPGQVGTATGTTEHDVGAGLHLRELHHGLLADHTLVQHNMIEHRAQRVAGVGVLRGHLNGLTDRHPQAAGGVRVLASIARPDSVRSDGLGCRVPP